MLPFAAGKINSRQYAHFNYNIILEFRNNFLPKKRFFSGFFCFSYIFIAIPSIYSIQSRKNAIIIKCFQRHTSFICTIIHTVSYRTATLPSPKMRVNSSSMTLFIITRYCTGASTSSPLSEQRINTRDMPSNTFMTFKARCHSGDSIEGTRKNRMGFPRCCGRPAGTGGRFSVCE